MVRLDEQNEMVMLNTLAFLIKVLTFVVVLNVGAQVLEFYGFF